MNSNTDHFSLDNLQALSNQLDQSPWLVACLCAAWCDTCQSYRPQFEELSRKQNNKIFAWIDIEDHADLIEDLDIENFPTILIEYEAKVLFLGTMLPDATLVGKLLSNLESVLETKPLTAIAPMIQEANRGIGEWSLSKKIKAQN
ncbi:thioredoxin family protein [Undibacterium cyanobacteriorum]|uniref:Thioredoxin family protein n=1 Tax=Undibacterium cyanobacteriorum TaxID=3073561 RepID=A0ABY9RM21_9BURK|nr:thioredoxin family protein [Undibacterium sp. 20NA77.5]WMW82262.1 thioredoxin family protein [Undibacterium sp. 20NA77.5]